MIDGQTFEAAEDRLLTAALNSVAFRKSVPPTLVARWGNGESGIPACPRRRAVPWWLKVAASVAVLASFVSFAAVVWHASRDLKEGESETSETNVSVAAEAEGVSVDAESASPRDGEAHATAASRALPSLSRTPPRHLQTATSAPFNLSTIGEPLTSGGEEMSAVAESPRLGDASVCATLAVLDTRVHAVLAEGVSRFDTVVHDRKTGPGMNLNCTKRSFTIVFR